MEIIEALRQLDPKNDEHWTRDGVPAMAAVESLVGDAGITRDQVTKAAPEFSRTNPVLPGEAPDTGEKAEPSETATGDGSGTPLPAIDDPPALDEEEAGEELAEARAKLQDLQAELEKVEEDYTRVTRERRELLQAIARQIDHVEKLQPPHSNQRAIMDHIRKENQRKADQFRQVQQQQPAGGPSTIDKALQGQPARPQFTPQQ